MVQVNPRCMWPNEAYDFTPWLAENLALLGETVGLKLEPVRQEQQVGSFSLDILAREADEGVTVAIENQLEWTDHSHLGQLLTYAAGCKAQIGIWVASEFQHEHAEALHWLNQWGDTNVRFYGVKVEVVEETDGNSLQPRLHTVVSPGGWNKDLTLPQPPPPNPEIEKHRRFFDPLVATMLNGGFADSCRNVWSHNARFFPSAFDGEMGYTVSLERDGAWVFFLIRTWESVDLANDLFDALGEQRQEIESSINAQGEWRWDKFAPYSFATIGVHTGGWIDDSPERHEAVRAWMIDLLPRFKATFEERTAKLLAELRQPEKIQTTGE